MTSLPQGIIADALNTPTRRVNREKNDRSTPPNIHVSSLIKSKKEDVFCAKEFALNFLEKTHPGAGGLPPKFELLFATGHFLGDYIVKEFIKRSPDYAKYVWGDWECQCRETKRIRERKPGDNHRCPSCEGTIDRYVETDLIPPNVGIVGHADLILCDDDGRLYVYEFKTIDRSDIEFDDIKEPLGDHVLQASFYYYILRAMGYTVSRTLRFVYIDRSMKEIYRAKPYIEVTSSAAKPSRIKPLLLKAKKAQKAARTGRLPLGVCEKITDSRTNKCRVAISCFYRNSRKVTRT